MRDFPTTRNLLLDWTNNGIFPGISIGVIHSENQFWRFDAGFASFDPPVRASRYHVWPVASLSKPVTATIIVQLIDQNRLDLNRPVADWLPEFSDRKVLLRHLLTHSSGIGFMSPEPESVAQKGRIRAIAETGLLFEPGSKCNYSTPGFDLASAIVERVTGKDWTTHTVEAFFHPLGMADSTFKPPAGWAERIAVVYNIDDSRDPWWSKHDLTDLGIAGGGLFSTVPDLILFARAFLHRGTPILSESAFQQMITLQTPGLFNLEGKNETWGLGWYLNQDRRPENSFGPSSEKAFGHGGATGSFMVVDPENDFAFVLLANRVGIPFLDSVRLQNQLSKAIFADLHSVSH